MTSAGATQPVVRRKPATHQHGDADPIPGSQWRCLTLGGSGCQLMPPTNVLKMYCSTLEPL